MRKTFSIFVLVIICFNYIFFTTESLGRTNDFKVSSRGESPRTGHTQKEAAETLAAWCINFYNKHRGQCVYYNGSWGSPREITYKKSVSDSDKSTQYEFDCVGFVSFAVHHALGIGGSDFTYFAVPDDSYFGGGDPSIGNGFKRVYTSAANMQAGDLIIMGHHVGVYVGNGKSVSMWQTSSGGLQYIPVETDFANGGFSGYVGRITAETAKNANFAYMQGAEVVETLQMKGTKMADCAFENDGIPGDSTGLEWQVKEWFRDGKYYAWDKVYRYPDENVARTIAICAIKGANNDNIGYKFEGWGGGSRQNSLGYELEKVNFDLSAINTKCDSICSLSTSNVVKAAGYALNMEQLKSIPTNSYTAEANYPGRGFQTLTDSKYLNSTDNLLAGDILVNTGVHVNIFVGNGEIGSGDIKGSMQYPIDDITINLDEQNFEFSGTPKTVTYSGTKKAGEWIFSLFSQFVDFIIALITNGIKTSILGWAMTFEGAIDASLKFLEGQ